MAALPESPNRHMLRPEPVRYGRKRGEMARAEGRKTRGAVDAEQVKVALEVAKVNGRYLLISTTVTDILTLMTALLVHSH